MTEYTIPPNFFSNSIRDIKYENDGSVATKGAMTLPADFYAGDAMLLAPAANGGWVVSLRNGKPGYAGTMLGAFTCTADMIAALDAMLKEKDRTDD